ncbi:hypothetical protein [Cupriavidus sp. D384]|uniref:hypothetical protein n=1 Tax=Cupriavidus sp. D384 TaxID=1538095 RepID=UPI0012E79A43|nr:hypothetical protein [Cupriavidus sp. D384]
MSTAVTQELPTDSEPGKPESEIERDLFRRVGYYDFRAYRQLTSNGMNQGFVLARHHTLSGTIQTAFGAGKAQAKSSDALAIALEKLEHLAAIAAEDGLPFGLPMDSGERSI